VNGRTISTRVNKRIDFYTRGGSVRKVMQKTGSNECLRCAIASILGESKSVVPDFVGEWSDGWNDVLDGWLRARDLFAYRATGAEPWLFGDRAADEWVGIVQRGGETHAVVCAYDYRYQPVIVHDPASDTFDPHEPILETLVFAKVGGNPWAGGY
jgi:hypothetical protein